VVDAVLILDVEAVDADDSVGVATALDVDELLPELDDDADDEAVEEADCETTLLLEPDEDAEADRVGADEPLVVDDAVDTALTRGEATLTKIEEELVDGLMNDEQNRQLGTLKQQALDIKRRIDTLPTTTEQVRARKERIQVAIDALEKQAFQLGVQLQSQSAQLTAIRKFVDDTRAQRKNKAEDEKAFLEKVTFEQRALAGMQVQLDELRAQLLAERNNADKAVGGEGQLKTEYAALMEQERQILAQARQGSTADAQKILLRADVVRADANALRDRVTRSKTIVRERVAQKAQKLREQERYKISIIFFFHLPFPTSQIFRALPSAADLLYSMTCAGFAY
jgi:hypothetical protein